MTKFPPSIFQRVERASSEAAREVFGNNYQSVLEQVHVDDDALVEGISYFTNKCSTASFHCQFGHGTIIQRER